MKHLEIASDVVCLLTSRSLDRPWIAYEAGVAKGKLNTPVYGLALGLEPGRANVGPFAQLKNCDDKEESLTRLVLKLLSRIPESEPDPDAVRERSQYSLSLLVIEVVDRPPRQPGDRGSLPGSAKTD